MLPCHAPLTLSRICLWFIALQRASPHPPQAESQQPRSTVAGSHGESVFGFVRIRQTALQGASVHTICIPHQQGEGPPAPSYQQWVVAVSVPVTEGSVTAFTSSERAVAHCPCRWDVPGPHKTTLWLPPYLGDRAEVWTEWGGGQGSLPCWATGSRTR